MIGRPYVKTFKQFITCMQWAREGKTFVYMHPDFVAVDMKTWEKIQRELHPPIKQQVIYDEYSDWTPEAQAELNKYFEKRIARRLK